VTLAAAVALAGFVALGCGRYGPPRRPEPVTPLVVVAPATDPSASAPGKSEEQCEAPSP
jgi:hypothetical protein